ncbi:uncharacterized protein TNCV_1231611 [Trichonephila clavipes]|nr:uncharacterized protein TNCV_1231611 [Trichonephila clavipes]
MMSRSCGSKKDGATCHTSRATIDLLKGTFGDRLISRFGPVNWPPKSCDLTPLDYFLWGYVKSLGLRVGHYREMKFDRDGRRSYRNCENYLDTDLTPAYIFAIQLLLLLFFSSVNLFVNNIEQIARTDICAHGTIWFSPVMDTISPTSLNMCSQI